MPRFRVLFATGSHFFTNEEKRDHEYQALGPNATKATDVEWHDCHDDKSLRPLGRARLHQWTVEAKNILVVGSIEPHYFAGMTGAHKTLTVGTMSYDSIGENHRHALSSRATSFALDGNPVYDGVAALAAEFVTGGRNVFAINEVLVDKRLVFCLAGDLLQSLAEALPVVRRVFGRRLPRPVDLVVARVAPPLDKSLYQADKGIKNVETAVRDGGVILAQAPCEQGPGIDRFLKLMERSPTYAKALEVVETEGYVLGDHKAVRLRELTDRRGVKLGIVSSHISRREARIAGLEPFTGPEQATRWALNHLSERAREAVLVEDAGNMTLFL